jgi:hypothetical protein
MKTRCVLNFGLSLAIAFGLACSSYGQGSKTLYENNFEKASLDNVPDDFLILEGAFAVKQDGTNKFLELPGTPPETFGALFGPTEPDGVAVSGRIHGTGKGRRSPTFAVSLNGAGGYRLQVSPAKKSLELYKADLVKSAVPFDWQSDQWTLFRLQVRKVKDGEWKVEGKAWTQGGPEPAWQITVDEKEAPLAGRAGLWGSPYAGTPIRFDDLVVSQVGAPK